MRGTATRRDPMRRRIRDRLRENGLAMREAAADFWPLDTDRGTLHGWRTGRLQGRKCGMNRKLTVIVEREGDGYMALCPEADIASQGGTVAEAHDNLEEALTLFFETAPAEEVGKRLRG